jgi:hypothetical protein
MLVGLSTVELFDAAAGTYSRMRPPIDKLISSAALLGGGSHKGGLEIINAPKFWKFIPALLMCGAVGVAYAKLPPSTAMKK